MENILPNNTDPVMAQTGRIVQNFSDINDNTQFEYQHDVIYCGKYTGTRITSKKQHIY